MTIKCSKMLCMEKAIIRFEYKQISNQSYCLDHLVERLEYIRDKEHFHLISNIKKIIPIYSF